MASRCCSLLLPQSLIRFAARPTVFPPPGCVPPPVAATFRFPPSVGDSPQPTGRCLPVAIPEQPPSPQTRSETSPSLPAATHRASPKRPTPSEGQLDVTALLPRRLLNLGQVELQFGSPN